MEDGEEIRIEVDPQIGTLLEERGIRMEDVQRVIAHAHNTKKVFRSHVTHHHVSYYRPSKTTYWVEYGQKGDSYWVYCAYSHRMEILEGFNMPAKNKEKSPEWLCVGCEIFLELATVKLTYLDETFGVDLPACPSCQRVFVSEENAVKKMALAEKMLEDK
jgi:hypothetical protein